MYSYGKGIQCISDGIRSKTDRTLGGCTTTKMKFKCTHLKAVCTYGGVSLRAFLRIAKQYGT